MTKEESLKLLRELEARGLDALHYTVIEGIGKGDRGLAYRPQADVSNLMVPVVIAALNHLDSKVPAEDGPAADSINRQIADIWEAVALAMNSRAHELSGEAYSEELRKLWDRLVGISPTFAMIFVREVALSMMLAYSVAVKAKLQFPGSDQVIQKTPIHYFAVFNFLGDLSRETAEKVISELKEKQLWATD